MCEESSIRDKNKLLVHQKKTFLLDRLKALKESKIQLYYSLKEVPKIIVYKPIKEVNIATLLKLRPSQIKYPKSEIVNPTTARIPGHKIKSIFQRQSYESLPITNRKDSFYINGDTEYIPKYINTRARIKTANQLQISKLLDSSGSNILIHRIKMRKENERIIDPLAMDSYNRGGEYFGLQNKNFEYFDNTSTSKHKSTFLIQSYKKKDNKIKNNYFANNIKMKLMKDLKKHSQ
jgi:hypothetical protein